MTTVTQAAIQESMVTISNFLVSAFDDERLTTLRADAAANAVPHGDNRACLVSHTGVGYRPVMYQRDTPERESAVWAYFQLGLTANDRSDKVRQQRLLGLCDLEIERRQGLRVDVLAGVKEFAARMVVVVEEV